MMGTIRGLAARMARIFGPAFVALALASIRPAHAESPGRVVNFVSAPSVGNLECPKQAGKPKPSEHPSHTPPYRSGQANTRIPAITELGPLAQTTIHEQPLIDPRIIPGLALQDNDQSRHIAVWGDSHISAGPFMPTLLQALRADGMTTGTYYLPPTMGRANVHLSPVRAFCVGPDWNTELSYTAPATLRSGPALVNRVADAHPGSYLWLDLRDADGHPVIRRLRIVYRTPVDSALTISVNDGAEDRITLSASGDSRILTLRGDAPVSTVKLWITQGSLALYGFILDYVEPPQLTLDVFGIPSATARGWANIDPDYLRQSLHGVDYDGIILEYGTNEGNVNKFERDKYATLLTQALTNLRQVFPAASCVLVGPPDRGVLRDHGAAADLLTFGRIHQQIETAQREIGKRFGCVAWDWQNLMGGPGGSYGWFYAAPPLMGHDLTHLSQDGYRQTGRALAHSLGWQR